MSGMIDCRYLNRVYSPSQIKRKDKAQIMGLVLPLLLTLRGRTIDRSC